ncbi:hypothetical protein AOPFMNJM_0352 [Methylobacterium jeotgali]|uniref:RNA-binding protein n=2 Tax=Methylobacteriaceae TaxID=119045 RepID=A0ABQ4SPC0_9HYPH|nr:hypothetical protein AwMethylo_37550 [Methylobacterium sp.]GJE05057.1 hypothetical protein AOPFMNJM_0352 [Methylobacterium jeotgali]
MVAEGRIRLNGLRVENAAKAVGPGDVLTIAAAHGTVVARVLAVSERRGGAPEAQRLYEPVEKA